MSGTEVTRRRFGELAGGALASLVMDAGCVLGSQSGAASDGRLTVRPRAARSRKAQAGRSALGLDNRRDALLQVPETSLDGPLPLIVLLHGAGGSGEGVLRRLGSAPDAAGVAVLAPDSRDATWDGIRSGFGRDVTFIDRALERVFDSIAVDPARVGVGGFSDGATYALSLGLVNGDLFTRVVAFSPGFVVDGPTHGTPRFFISHGTADPILPIDQCSRRIVPALQRRGYDVTFREFDGGHEVPPAIARDALQWMTT